MPDVTKGAALVTGASSGIGLAIARRFAREHFNLILVARSSEGLARAADLCRAEGKGEVFSLQKDLTKDRAAKEVMQAVRDRGWSIEVLVNNAGFGIHGNFAESDLEKELAMIRLQLSCLLELTKEVLPAMKERRRGRLLNVGSVYSFLPVPKQSVYGACKAFIRSFSEALATELKPHGITVTLLCPGITATEFRRSAGMKEKKSILSMSAEAVADQGFRGTMRGKRVVVPGVFNRLFVGAMSILPAAIIRTSIVTINRLRGIEAQPNQNHER